MNSQDEAVKEALRRACEEVGLPLVYRSAVGRLLRTPRDEWPSCCGGACSLCAQSLADAADRALELLGTPVAD